MKPPVARGHLELLLLAALQSGPAHGYAIIEKLRSLSDGRFDFAEGTVYPALQRLAHAGLLEDRWSTVGGRRRRVYELTSEGTATLVERREDYERHSWAMNAVLQGRG